MNYENGRFADLTRFNSHTLQADLLTITNGQTHKTTNLKLIYVGQMNGIFTNIYRIIFSCSRDDSSRSNTNNILFMKSEVKKKMYNK